MISYFLLIYIFILVLNETEDIDDKFIPAAKTNFPVTRKSKSIQSISRFFLLNLIIQ